MVWLEIYLLLTPGVVMSNSSFKWKSVVLLVNYLMVYNICTVFLHPLNYPLSFDLNNILKET